MLTISTDKSEYATLPPASASSFRSRLEAVDLSYSYFDTLRTVQLNLGNRCNLSCSHCHVEASPSGKRFMGKEIMDHVITYIGGRQDITLDITGGCPELNPNFHYLMEQTEALGIRRILRTNLAIAAESGMEWLPEFYQKQGLTLVASLPCFKSDNVDRQRGQGVFQKSIATLKKLNELGYGDTLELNLIYNPDGDMLPSSQRFLESCYRKELLDNFGICFSNLFTITNVPIGRFKAHLAASGNLESYLQKLADAFNPVAASVIMCRSLISIDYRGYLYNCDFNQALGMPVRTTKGIPLGIQQLAEATRRGNPLVLGDHCFSCTAGEGSSCCGATAV